MGKPTQEKIPGRAAPLKAAFSGKRPVYFEGQRIHRYADVRARGAARRQPPSGARR